MLEGDRVSDHKTRVSTAEQTVLKRLGRETTSATVSYTHDSGLFATVVGHGASERERIADADSQLPGGGWTRDVVSTPSTVYMDLIVRPQVVADGLGGYSRHSLIANSRYEGKRVEL
jgi:hypothetical protein